MDIETEIPLIDEILSDPELSAYRNHVYRMVNFCFAQGDFSEADREKIVIAGCFHDLGIWSADTFDYLPPSITLATDYLAKLGRAELQEEISAMIDFHHRLRKFDEGSLVEVFRCGDLVDFSLGVFKCGLPHGYVREVKRQFPNAGFHRDLIRRACSWTLRHPLNPLPILKW